MAGVPVCTKRLVHIHRRREKQFLGVNPLCFLAMLAEITSVTISADEEMAPKCCKLLHFALEIEN
jgi:hypothetical protein